MLTSIAAYVVVEPVLEGAIALEGGGEGPIGRQTQKLLGLPIGLLLIGLSLGLLFALAYQLLPSTSDAWHRSLGLALGGFLALALTPQLRYPANPPGVGDPDTITGRTSSYLLAVALGVAVVTTSYWALRTLARKGIRPSVRQPLVVLAGVLVVTAGYLLLPDSGDPNDLPASLVWDFRIRSLGVLALLYASLGTIFGLLTERAERSVAVESLV